MHSSKAWIIVPAVLATGCIVSVVGSSASAVQGAEAANGPYLDGSPIPNGLELVPPPPFAGSVAEARDRAGADAAVQVQSGPRWQLAIKDVNLAPRQTIKALSCSAGFSIAQEGSPALLKIISRAIHDLGPAAGEVKKHYMRPRPFVVNGKPTCTPTWERGLRQDGSYPSSHSTVGFGVSLILAEVAPDRASQILARGKAIGDSRRICNVHWLSDIEEGRMIATATVMRLNANPSFQADLQAARAEVRSLPAPMAPRAECATETASLSNPAANKRR